jgi:hypothetical protein
MGLTNLEAYKTIWPGILTICTFVISQKKEMIIHKLDFEKAFDKIEHEVIIQILRHKGFPEKWIEWIQGILTSVTSSILLNGTLEKVFHCRRGVRQ